MDNPNKQPMNKDASGIRNTSVSLAISLMVVLIYVAFNYYFASGVEIPILSAFNEISFEVFLFCSSGTLLLISYNKILLDKFYMETKIITSKLDLEKLKPIARVNMYSFFLNLLFLSIGTIAALFIIFYRGGSEGIITAIISTIFTFAMKWYTPSELRVKTIKCNNEDLETELRVIIDNWSHKALPKF